MAKTILQSQQVYAYNVVSIVFSDSPYAPTTTAGVLVILCDCTSGNIEIDMPTAVGNKALFRVKKTDSSANTVTIDPNGAQTIDGGSTAVMTSENEAIDIISDNANLKIF